MLHAERCQGLRHTASKLGLPLAKDECCGSYDSQKAKRSLARAQELVDIPESATSLHVESLTVREQCCKPELDGETRPGRSVAPKFPNVPISASAGEDTVAKLQVNVIGGLVLNRLLHFDRPRTLLQERFHKSSRCVIDLHFACVQGRVVCWECVRTKSIKTLALAPYE